MKCLQNIFGLRSTWKRSVSGAVCVLSALCAVFMASCHTASQVPMDDAYYWPDRTIQHASHTTENNPASLPAGEGQGGAPAIEYLNVQDTTVTIRIKR